MPARGRESIAGAHQAAAKGFRKSSTQVVQLRIWTKPGGKPVEREGPEADLIKEFHRLKDEGVVYALDLGARFGVAAGTWISWRNPEFATAPTPTRPHCGGPL